MMSIRSARERGHENHGWLDTFHTFSFADYYDPAFMGFRALRVLNDDRVDPGKGFGTHPHRDMEILTYILDGALEHRDSMGTGSVIRPGEVQRMSAGTGVTHSEKNASTSALVHFLQIWLLPVKRGLAPGYEQKAFDPLEKDGRLRLLASPDGSGGSVTVHSDARLYAGVFDQGQSAKLELAPERYAWVHVARGRARVNGVELGAGDGASLTPERGASLSVDLEGVERGEVLVFDLG